MAYICYQPMNFRGESLTLIKQADAIIREYSAQGYILTLRQLYYQFVARDILPNSQQSYKRLGSLINDARMAGLIDWDAIEDRTRNLRTLPSWSSVGEIIQACAAQFRVDLWHGQHYRPEVWVEKEALAGVIQRSAEAYGVPWFCCRGYTSASEMHGAAMRLLSYIRNGQVPFIIHLGDHDPSGIDMSRDIMDRLATFILHHEHVERSPWACYDNTPEVPELADQALELLNEDADPLLAFHRIALNEDQVRHYNPPPNPAKLTDSRAEGYIRLFGRESWELDALDPATLDGLIKARVTSLIDKFAWDEQVGKMEKGREGLSKASSRWDEIEILMSKEED
jgi:hypothetical protein